MKKPNIGFTGTRSGMTERQKKELRKYLEMQDCGGIFHHGDCVGADAEAHQIASRLGYEIVIHPPKNPKERAYCWSVFVKPEKEYLKRNHDIVDDSNILLAAPKSKKEVVRSGTWATIRYAHKIGKKVIVLDP